MRDPDYTTLKISLDRLHMSALADEVDKMSPEAVAQLAKLKRNAYLEVPIPKFLQRLRVPR